MIAGGNGAQNNLRDLGGQAEHSPMSTATSLTPAGRLSAEEFAARPDQGCPEELVEGQVVAMTPPSRRHGLTCAEVVYRLRLYLEEHRLGRVMGNDSVIVTRRDPDSVRGADVAYYSYASGPGPK